MYEPKVSVIIPVYNTEAYLCECLDSVVNQTLFEIEIICINDGSTDGSLTILNDYANKDERIRIVNQENKGGGAARNAGLKIAKGEYLAFLDSDDFYNRKALERLYNNALKHNSDIVAFRGKKFTDGSRKYENISWIFMKEYFPNKIPFSYLDMQDYIFQVFSSVVWNKLFRKKMIEKHDIQFMELKKSNDSFFTYLSLIRANYISVLDEALIFYRNFRKNSSQYNYQAAPIDFYLSLAALKEELEKLGIFNYVERSYVNRVIDISIYYLALIKDIEVYKYYYNVVKTKILQEINLANLSKEYFFECFQHRYKEALLIMSLSFDEYIFKKYKDIIQKAEELSGSAIFHISN